jgi:hypothetical protein
MKHKITKGEIVALLAHLIPTIADDDRADPEATDPSMSVTFGADPDGWSYQTGDNSFTGGAYGYQDWAVITIDRDSDPDSLAEDVLGQFGDLDDTNDDDVGSLTPEDIAHLRSQHAESFPDGIETEDADGPEDVMCSLGYVALWPDGDVIANGITLTNVVED